MMQGYLYIRGGHIEVCLLGGGRGTPAKGYRMDTLGVSGRHSYETDEPNNGTERADIRFRELEGSETWVFGHA